MLKNRIFSAFALVSLAGFAACAEEPVEEAIIEEPLVEEPIVAPAPAMDDTMMMTDTMMMPGDTMM
ncbi:MAG TPA: hypothetical protein VFI91_09870 [Longimicrobiaceae bacterium]|nr:hypothetical protein [Longimicrobiaceae bacterium]